MDMMPAVSSEVSEALSAIKGADLMVAIPAFNNEQTISNVMRVAAEGLSTFFADMNSVLFVCEGGSLDDTSMVAKKTDIGVTVRKLVGKYRGTPGKGSALRSIFQVARELGVRGCALIDADMRSLTPDWVNNLLSPVLDGDYDFVTPYYKRYKFDGTITNVLVYPMVTSLYGKRLRQPIGGDFGLSGRFIEFLMDQDVWDKYVSQFGIDIWLTVSAITGGHKICQADLGAKVHDAKDPAFSLGPMYMQVLSTLFRSMSRFRDYWMSVSSFEDVEVLGTSVPWSPEPIPISVTRLVEEFVGGMAHFSPLYREIFSVDTYRRLEKLASSAGSLNGGYSDFFLPPDLWARVVYDLVVTFNLWENNTHKLIDLSSPLYYGKVASLANRIMELSYEESENVIEDMVRTFENQKEYLVERWNESFL